MSKFTLFIGNKNVSSWSLRGFLVLKHAEVEFDEVLISLRPVQDRQKLDDLTPAGKVPTVKHGENYIWDSLAIAEYFNDLYSQKDFWPKDINMRAHARCVSAEMHSGFPTLRNVMPMACHNRFDHPEKTPELMKDIDRVKSIWAECLQQYKDLGPYLFGEYSIADMMYAPVVFRFNSYQVELSEELKAYSNLILNHPHVKEWVAESDPNDLA